MPEGPPYHEALSTGERVSTRMQSIFLDLSCALSVCGKRHIRYVFRATRNTEKLEKPMYCLSCGHQNRSDARFCDKCGARLSQGGQAGNMPPPQPQFGTPDTGPGGMGWQSPT